LLQNRIEKANPRRELTSEEEKRLAKLEAIGIGAPVKHNVSIGYNCIIGASSLVNKDATSYGLFLKIKVSRYV